jgi:hypothetical protein
VGTHPPSQMKYIQAYFIHPLAILGVHGGDLSGWVEYMPVCRELFSDCFIKFYNHSIGRSVAPQKNISEMLKHFSLCVSPTNHTVKHYRRCCVTVTCESPPCASIYTLHPESVCAGMHVEITVMLILL